MNKAELVKAVASRTGYSLTETEQIIEEALTVVKETVATGETVQLVNYGKLELKEYRERGYSSSSRNAPKFTASESFKSMCNPETES